MAKSYKATAQSLFIGKVTRDFPNWDIVSADISTGILGLSSGDILVYLGYDTEDEKYYPVKIVKHEKGMIAWNAGTLERVKDIFGQIPKIDESEGEGENI